MAGGVREQQEDAELAEFYAFLWDDAFRGGKRKSSAARRMDPGMTIPTCS
jgi:hypothetical protein